MSDTICEAFMAAADLAIASGAAPLNRHIGCWETSFGRGWSIALNGHNTTTRDSRGMDVPPFSLAVYWGDFPAGVLNPRGGWLAAGEGANEDAFIEAVRARLAEATNDR